MLVSSAASADAPPAGSTSDSSGSRKSTSSGGANLAGSARKGVSIDQLEGPRLGAAMGHFSRARHLLISAVHEFDAGAKIANPDLLVNSDAWRKAVLAQASELDQVLSPQPAEARGGVKYPGDSRLLTESKP